MQKKIRYTEMPDKIFETVVCTSVRNKDLGADGHRATGCPKVGGPTENPVAQIVFHKS